MDWLIGGKQGEAKRLIAQLSDVTKRERAAQDLIRLGADSATPLIEALSHPEMWIRIHAIMGLSQFKDSRVAPILIEMLNDPEREVKKQVIRSLGGLKDARAVPVLQQIMTNRSDRELHTLAKEVLEMITKV
jgi:HEAT repeat protein